MEKLYGPHFAEEAVAPEDLALFQPDLPPVQAILYDAYAPGNVVERGHLDEMATRLLGGITARYGEGTALTYLAHVLQEVQFADSFRPVDSTPIDAEPLFSALAAGTDPHALPIRFQFNESTGLHVAHIEQPTLERLDDLLYLEDGEQLRGKRVLFLGMGGGSDVIQAAALSELLAQKYGIDIAAFASVRKAANKLTNVPEVVGSNTLKFVVPQTKPEGNWRFLEDAMLSNPADPLAETPMYIINSIETAAVVHDLELLNMVHQPDIIIGVDTGGDSLYRTQHASFSAINQSTSTPDQDYQVLVALHQVQQLHPNLQVASAVVAPGIDSPPYAKEVLQAMQAVRLPLDTSDKQQIISSYALRRMDGSGNAEGRYGKTPLAWLAALAGYYGLRVLNLPPENVVSARNRWRTYANITPAMSEITLASIDNHMRSIDRAA